MRSAGSSSKRYAPLSTRAVSEHVTHLVRRTHQRGILYASHDWSPLSDLTLALLLRRAGISWSYAPLDGVAEIVWPPVCGVYHLQLEREQTPGERRFATRHGLAHVLAGDVDGVSWADTDHDWPSREETIADLFALADLIPDRMIEEWRVAGFTRPEQHVRLRCEIQRYCPAWPDARIEQRARQRYQLRRVGCD